MSGHTNLLFYGATATPPWFARQPQRGRCGSNKPIVGGYHSKCEISELTRNLRIANADSSRGAE
jgi:hypothetical protein